MNKRKVKVYMPKAQDGMEQGAPQGQAQEGNDQMQQVMQMVQQMVEQGAQPAEVAAQLLQQGIPPEALMQIFVQMGMPEQEAQAAIQAAMQGSGQEQGPGEEQMEGSTSNPQEEAMEQPMMANGGEAANDQLMQIIVAFADMQGVDPKEIMSQLQQMDEAGQQQAMANMQQVVSEAQGQAPEQAEQPMMRNGGGMHQMPDGSWMAGNTHSVINTEPTAKDFKDISKDMVKKYKAGGTTKLDDLDRSNTEAYISNLKGAITNELAKNNAIATVQKRTKANVGLFDDLTKAKDGIEVKGKTYNSIDELNLAQEKGEVSQSDYNAAVQSAKDQKIWGITNPTTQGYIPNFTSKYAKTTKKNEPQTSSDFDKPNRGFTPLTGESYDDMLVRNKQTVGFVPDNRVWDGTQWITAKTQEEFDKIRTNPFRETNTTNTEVGRTFPGQLTDYGKSTQGGGNQGFLTAPLFGALGRFGKARGPRTQTGNVHMRGTGAAANFDSATLNARINEVMSNPSAYNASIEDIRRKGLFGRDKRNETNIFGRSNVIGKRIQWGQPGTQQGINNPILTTSNNQNSNEAFAQPNTGKLDYWTRKQNNELLRNPADGPSVGPKTTSNILGPPDVQLPNEMVDVQPSANDQALAQALADTNTTIDQYLNNEGGIRTEIDKYAGLTPSGQTTAALPSTTPTGTTTNPVTQGYSGAGNQSFVNFKPIPDDKSSLAAKYYNFKPQMSNGGIYWDAEQLKFVNGGTIPKFSGGGQPMNQMFGYGVDVLPEEQRTTDWGQTAENVYAGMNVANELAKRFGPYNKSNEQTAAQRAPDNVFNVADGDSGESGYYDQWGRWIPIDMGAPKRAGSSGDYTANMQGTQKNLYGEFTNNDVYKLAGGTIAANGMEVGDKYDLREDEIAYLQRLGYNIKRIG
jgi:hypothetical protein